MFNTKRHLVDRAMLKLKIDKKGKMRGADIFEHIPWGDIDLSVFP